MLEFSISHHSASYHHCRQWRRRHAARALLPNAGNCTRLHKGRRVGTDLQAVARAGGLWDDLACNRGEAPKRDRSPA